MLGPAAKVAVPDLVQILLDPEVDDQVRGRVALILGDIGPATQDVVRSLIQALGDENHKIRQASAGGLGKIGPPAKDAVRALIKAAEDKEYGVRWQAIVALGEIGAVTQDVVPALIKALGDEEGAVWEAAARVLGEIGPLTEDVVPALIKALEDEEKRRFVAEALEKIGPLPKDAILALNEALRGEEDKDVRRSITRVLRTISTREVQPEGIEVMGDMTLTKIKEALIIFRKVGEACESRRKPGEPTMFKFNERMATVVGREVGTLRNRMKVASEYLRLYYKKYKGVHVYEDKDETPDVRYKFIERCQGRPPMIYPLGWEAWEVAGLLLEQQAQIEAAEERARRQNG